MNTEQHQITVSGLRVEIVRKDIKNLHLGVYPPTGRIRVAAPLRISNEAVRLAVVGKLGWIRRQRANFERQPRQSAREMVSGESHYFLGQRYRLRVYASEEGAKVVVRNSSIIELHVPPGSGQEARQKLMMTWYRQHLRTVIPPLLKKWQEHLGVKAPAYGIKKMKTKWGTCNANAGRIWINLDLAKKSVECLEYVVVHELVHLVVRRHDEHFVRIMDKWLPRWRALRAELNGMPLAHEVWAKKQTNGC
jgi:predicted metal-dependent hydrolase